MLEQDDTILPQDDADDATQTDLDARHVLHFRSEIGFQIERYLHDRPESLGPSQQFAKNDGDFE